MSCLTFSGLVCEFQVFGVLARGAVKGGRCLDMFHISVGLLVCQHIISSRGRIRL